MTNPPPGEFSLVGDAQPRALIVLPGETEFDRFLGERLAAFDAHPRQSRTIDRDAYAATLREHMDETGDDERLAAAELRDIVQAITGATLPIGAPDHAGERRILLGAQLARESGLGDELDALAPDGFLCRTARDTLILAGRRARGTLYAVYHLLATFGCRWVMPGDFGAIYPQRDTLETNINCTENPDHTQRYWWCTYGHAAEYPRWTLRNKGNFVRALGDPIIRQNHALAAPLRWEAKRRAVDHLPDDYYAYANGKVQRHTPALANPDVWDLFADYCIDYFDRGPEEDYVSLSAEDGLVLDERPESCALRSNEFDFTMGAFSATDQLWHFANQIIKRVEKVYPEKKFGILVYSNNLMPPRVERVHPKMAMVIAPLGICPLHHIRDDKCKSNKHYRHWLADWMHLAEAAGAETYLYDYEPLGYCWNMALICPRWAIVGRNYPHLHALGLTGHTTQGYDDWAACGFNNYLMAQLYWDASLDYRNVMRDYCAARFGNAVEAMMDYYATLERRMDDIPDLYANEVWDNHLVLTPAVRAQCREHLGRAEAAADTPPAAEHVRTMIDLQRSTDAFCDGEEHMRDTGDYGRAAEMMQPVFAVRDALNARYANFMNATRLDDTQEAPFFTGGIVNQYKKFAKRIAGAAASAPLPRFCKGMLDTGNRAVADGLHQPQTDASHLDELDTTVCPDVKYGTHREPAAFFYRCDLDVPHAFAACASIVLHFGGLIAKAFQLWINGRPVASDGGDITWRGPDFFWIDYNHERTFDVTAAIEPGRVNTIAFRVFKSFDFGGNYRRIWLLGSK